MLREGSSLPEITQLIRDSFPPVCVSLLKECRIIITIITSTGHPLHMPEPAEHFIGETAFHFHIAPCLGGGYDWPHFTDEETEVQREKRLIQGHSHWYPSHHSHL